MVEQLVREHREIAQLWKRLDRAVQAIANGYLPRLDSALLHELVRRFNEHVRTEEQEFLPFAQQDLAARPKTWRCWAWRFTSAMKPRRSWRRQW